MQLEDAARKRATEAQVRRILSDIHEQIHGSQLNTPTLSEYAAQWLARKERETARVTFAAYKHAVNEFVRSMGDRAGQPIHYVTSAQVLKWRDVAADRATPRTANNKLKIVRVLLQSAWRDGLIQENAAAKVSTLKADKSSRRPFSVAQIKAILAVANTEWRGLVLAGIYSGQRLKDLASLTWSNIDMEQGVIRFSTSKTGRFQVIPLVAPLRRHLESLASTDDPRAPLFPGAFQAATVHLHTGILSRQFHDLLIDAGVIKATIPSHKGTGKGRTAAREVHGLSFHSLRHTATSLLKNAGVSDAVARDIIGHESAAVSASYTHIEEHAKRSALEKLPDLT